MVLMDVSFFKKDDNVELSKIDIKVNAAGNNNNK